MQKARRNSIHNNWESILQRSVGVERGRGWRRDQRPSEGPPQAQMDHHDSYVGSEMDHQRHARRRVPHLPSPNQRRPVLNFLACRSLQLAVWPDLRRQKLQVITRKYSTPVSLPVKAHLFCTDRRLIA